MADDDSGLVGMANKVQRGVDKVYKYVRDHDTPVGKEAEQSTNMNWTPKPNAQQAAEIAKNSAKSQGSAGNGHPLTPKTSQRAQTRRDGTRKEYGQ